MSSTNRGSHRAHRDHYDTPEYTIQSLLDVHSIEYPALEPCAGNLAISNMLTEGLVHTNDINERSPAKRHVDYLDKIGFRFFGYKTIITNPPFRIAQQIIERALEDVLEGGEVIMLLRLNFLGAKIRKQFWQDVPLKTVYVLSRRPRFHGSGDSVEYAWFIFERGYTGKTTIGVI